MSEGNLPQRELKFHDPAAQQFVQAEAALRLGLIQASDLPDTHWRFEQMKHVLVAFTILAASVVIAPASTAEMAPTIEAADELVGLVKPHEHEAQAIRFMISVSPMDMPAGLADCTVKEAMPAMRSYFASQFTENLSKIEIQQAIAFFKSPAGQAVVALRLEHEQSLFDAAVKKEQVADEQLHYPASLQKDLETFGSTAAGKFFVGDELLARESIRAHASDLRNEAMAKCLVASK